MFRALTVWVALLWAPAAMAGGFVVWLEADVPDAKALKKASNLSGANTHMAHVDLAYPPQPASADDAAKLDKLRQVVSDGRARWDDFDVELGIAQELEGVLSTIDLVRDMRDLQDIVEARLFQGSAAHKAFDPQTFASDEAAAPFRVQYPGFVANRPWVAAMSLEPERKLTRADVSDGAVFPALQELMEPYGALPDGTIDTSDVPPGATLIVDGREVDATSGAVSLRPGEHYVHLIRRKLVAGRSTLSIQAGEALVLPMVVDGEELSQARAQVIGGQTAGFPDDVKSAIDALGDQYKGAIYVASVDDKGKVRILPYARGAKLRKAKVATFVGAGEVGGHVLITSLWDNETDPDKSQTGGGISGSLNVELGIYNFAMLGGSDVVISPGQTMTYGPAGDGTENRSSSVFAHPWGGVGVYVVRPSGATPTFLIAGTYGWLMPSHMAWGGRLVVGVPVDKNGTWFRIAAGGSAAPKPTKAWRDAGVDAGMYSFFLRVGLAARFN